MADEFHAEQAPGAPGMLSNWCKGAKQMVGTSLGPGRVWFTVGQGILNEIYYPRVDIPQVRDLGFIIADGQGFWQEVKLIKDCHVKCTEAGVPAVTVIHRHPRFTLTQRIVPEPNRDVILVETTLEGDEGLRPYVLLAPHLGGTGKNNKAEVGRFRGRRVLWAQQGPFGLALAAVDARQRDALGPGNAGYSGRSDAWQNFSRYGHMKNRYRQAGPGNVALSSALPRQSVIALGFGSSREAAATLSISSLLQTFELIWRQQIQQWQGWHARCHLCTPEHIEKISRPLAEQVRTSAMVLRTHQDRNFRGALVASLSVP